MDDTEYCTHLPSPIVWSSGSSYTHQHKSSTLQWYISSPKDLVVFTEDDFPNNYYKFNAFNV